MRRLFRDKEHLVRMGALFAAGVSVFVVLRALLVPDGFGIYGHFRAGALNDNQRPEPHYAGHQSCIECHDDVASERQGSRHSAIHCEACHGPLALHVERPSDVVPERPNGATICLVCHLANVAKPGGFPQVDPNDHGDGESCDECHMPHHPELDI